MVKTVEGLADGDRLHAVQEAFSATGAVQCGFCTPGFVVATADLLERVPEPSDDEIREALSGNLCRCTGYAKILEAVRLAVRPR
jgi:carbon-monoxide dehydrogenase small subunit